MPASTFNHDQNSAIYRVRVRGQLSAPLAEFLGDESPQLDSGDTLLTVSLSDQAALFGVLRKIRDLGLPLVSVERLEGGRHD